MNGSVDVPSAPRMYDATMYGTVQIESGLYGGEPLDAFSAHQDGAIVGGQRPVTPADTNVFSNRLPLPPGWTFTPRWLEAMVVRACRPPHGREQPTVMDGGLGGPLSDPVSERVAASLGRALSVQLYIYGSKCIAVAPLLTGAPIFIDWPIGPDTPIDVLLCKNDKVATLYCHQEASDGGPGLTFVDVRVKVKGIASGPPVNGFTLAAKGQEP